MMEMVTRGVTWGDWNGGNCIKGIGRGVGMILDSNSKWRGKHSLTNGGGTEMVHGSDSAQFRFIIKGSSRRAP